AAAASAPAAGSGRAALAWSACCCWTTAARFGSSPVPGRRRPRRARGRARPEHLPYASYGKPPLACRHEPRALIAEHAARCSVPELSFSANTEASEVQYWETLG